MWLTAQGVNLRCHARAPSSALLGSGRVLATGGVSIGTESARGAGRGGGAEDALKGSSYWRTSVVISSRMDTIMVEMNDQLGRRSSSIHTGAPPGWPARLSSVGTSTSRGIGPPSGRRTSILHSLKGSSRSQMRVVRCRTLEASLLSARYRTTPHSSARPALVTNGVFAAPSVAVKAEAPSLEGVLMRCCRSLCRVTCVGMRRGAKLLVKYGRRASSICQQTSVFRATSLDGPADPWVAENAIGRCSSM
mmetsp:Transcript_39499/g.112649  ORF Transcript_39499/g.112649 Transcript_39499/m.112649 type:complete len:249 (-) Transcript_39499:476-1222(-)